MPGRAMVESDRGSGSADGLEALLEAMARAFAAGDTSRLESLGAEAAHLGGRLHDARAECLGERAVAVAELRRGEAACALARLDRILPLARQAGDPELTMTLLGTLGTAVELIGDTRRSDEARLEVERIAIAIGNRARLGESMADRGSFRGLRGEAAAGAALIRDGVEILRPLGITTGLRWSLLQLSILESRLGRVAEAREHLRQAFPPELETEDALMLTNIVGALFGLALAEGRVATAGALWPTLLSALRTHGIYWQRAGFLEDLARPLAVANGGGSLSAWLDAEAVPVEAADLVGAIRAVPF